MLYLTADSLPVFVGLGLIGLYRYVWFIIRIGAWLAYSPVDVPTHPTYSPFEDVTIIVPTIDADEGFYDAARSWLQNRPKEILIVTEERMRAELERWIEDLQRDAMHKEADMRTEIRVLAVPKASKRLQMAEGIQAAQTDIIVFADDDALWPPTMLSLILACFEDQQIGGVGTSQVVKPCGQKLTVWEVLAAFRLSNRNVEIAASTHIDGGVPCLSGRTAACASYALFHTELVDRTIILKDPEFLYSFTHDYWRGKYLLNSGDDKFLTRWMVSHGWATYVQCTPLAELQSTMKPNWRFLKQVLRWTRNTWRSDLRSLFVERQIWSRHPYVCYLMLDKCVNPLTLLTGPILVVYLCARSNPGPDGYHLPAWNILISWCIWLTVTRGLKLAPHFWHHPKHVIYLPAWVAFSYYFALLKIYALFTLHKVDWGTRAISDEPQAALAARNELRRQTANLHRGHNTTMSPSIATLADPSIASLADYEKAAMARGDSATTLRTLPLYSHGRSG